MFHKDVIQRYYPCAIFILAFFLSLILAWFTVVPESDIARYGSIVTSFTEGDWQAVFHPRISPLVPVLGGVTACITGAGPFFALQIVSSLFFALLIFPLYGILKNCFSPAVTGIALLMAAFASIPMRYGASGLRDSAKGFFFVLCVYLFVEVFRNRAVLKNYIFLGISISLLALTRTEAPVYAALFGFAVLLLELCRRKIRFPWRSCICGLVALAVMAPWLVYMYKTTGYPVPEIRYVPLIKKVLHTASAADSCLPPLALAVAQEKKETAAAGENGISSRKTSSLYQLASGLPEINKADHYEGFFKAFADGMIGGFFPPLGILALLGIVLRLRKKEWTPVDTILLSALLLHAFLLALQIRISDHHFYMSRRYLITVVALEFGWSAYASLWIYEQLASRLGFLRRRWVIAFIFLIPCIGLYVHAFDRVIKSHTSRRKRAERVILFSISDYIRNDYRGPKTFRRVNRSDLEFQTNRLPAVLSGFPQLGFLSGGQTVSLADPMFSGGELRPDYIVCRSGGFSAETLNAQGYRFRRTFSAGKDVFELFSRNGRQD